MKVFKVGKDSWLINRENNISWMLSLNRGLYNLWRDGSLERYSEKDIHKIVNKECLASAKKMKISKNHVNYVYGYPVKSVNITYVDDGTGRHLFKKNKHSDTLYCAGYYSVFNNGFWTTCFCPKLTTLETCVKYSGPYKSEQELIDDMVNFKKRK